MLGGWKSSSCRRFIGPRFFCLCFLFRSGQFGFAWRSLSTIRQWLKGADLLPLGRKSGLWVILLGFGRLIGMVFTLGKTICMFLLFVALFGIFWCFLMTGFPPGAGISPGPSEGGWRLLLWRDCWLIGSSVICVYEFFAFCWVVGLAGSAGVWCFLSWREGCGSLPFGCFDWRPWECDYCLLAYFWLRSWIKPK